MGNRKTAAKRRRLRARLFKAQGGICYWCPARMINPEHSGLKGYTGERIPPLLCTTDHLDDRYTDERKRPLRDGEQRRKVAACWACNNRRSKERTAALPLAELHRRSGRAPVAQR